MFRRISISSSSLPPEHGEGDPMPDAMSSRLGEARAYRPRRLLASQAGASAKGTKRKVTAGTNSGFPSNSATKRRESFASNFPALGACGYPGKAGSRHQAGAATRHNRASTCTGSEAASCGNTPPIPLQPWLTPDPRGPRTKGGGAWALPAAPFPARRSRAPARSGAARRRAGVAEGRGGGGGTVRGGAGEVRLARQRGAASPRGRPPGRRPSSERQSPAGRPPPTPHPAHAAGRGKGGASCGRP